LRASLLAISFLGTMGSDSGSAAGSHLIETLVDVFLVIGSFFVLKETGCTSAFKCPITWVPLVTEVLFTVTSVATAAVLLGLFLKAQSAGADDDAAALKTRLIKGVLKPCILWVMHVGMGAMFPMVSGTLIALLGLPFWSDKDHTYLKEYWGVPIQGSSCCGSGDEARSHFLSLFFDLVLLVGAVLALNMGRCVKVKNCDKPYLITYALIFFGTFNGLLLLAQVLIICKAKKAGTDEGDADAKKVGRKMGIHIVKFALFFAAYGFLGLLAPLIASTLTALINLPVFSNYDQSLWKRYFGADAREYQRF